eukprot:9057862-Pyramimonas_sp.AAC.1
MVRLHHTADYVLQRVPPEEECQQLQGELDQRDQHVQMGPSSLYEAWQRWYRRAELGLRIAVEHDLVIMNRQAERPKGLAPSTRPVGTGSVRRPEQTI